MRGTLPGNAPSTGSAVPRMIPLRGRFVSGARRPRQPCARRLDRVFGSSIRFPSGSVIRAPEGSMSIDELTDVLGRWCDAVAAAELAPEGSPERQAAELRVRRLDLRVHRAALRLTGQRDQLEDAIE